MPSGRCLCGAVSFAYEGPENWRAHCHSESCRRATASPMTTVFGVSDGLWRWTGEQPTAFASSPGVTRSFCATCGSPVGFRAARFGPEQHSYASLLDDHSGFAPQEHVHWDERVAWLAPADDLPRKSGI